jgi:hypothetical protein
VKMVVSKMKMVEQNCQNNVVIKNFIVAVFIINKTGKFRELENNAITRPTVF